MTLRGLFEELLRASAAPSGQPSSVCPCDGLESSVDSSREQQPDPVCKPFSRASPPIPWPSNAYDMLGLLADKKTVNVMLDPLSEDIHRLERYYQDGSTFKKRTGRTGETGTGHVLCPNEIKEIISNEESFKTVTEFQSQIVTVEEKPFLEHVE